MSRYLKNACQTVVAFISSLRQRRAFRSADLMSVPRVLRARAAEDLRTELAIWGGGNLKRVFTYGRRIDNRHLTLPDIRAAKKAGVKLSHAFADGGDDAKAIASASIDIMTNRSDARDS